MAVLEYNFSFSNSDAVGRANYYGIQYVPTAEFNGRREVVGGGSGTFSTYLSNYNWEIQFFPSACTLNILVDYDSTTRKLWVKARVTAVDAFSNARLRYAIAESHIYHHWGGPPPSPVLDSVHHVVRKMLPNYVGVSIPAMNPNDTFIDSQTYTLSSAWEETNCFVVVFVQRDDLNTPVLRSAKSGLFQTWVFGDATGDGIVDVADVVYMINHLFADGPAPVPLASGDVTSDCILDVADVVYLINYLFADGPELLKGCAW